MLESIRSDATRNSDSSLFIWHSMLRLTISFAILFLTATAVRADLFLQNLDPDKHDRFQNSENFIGNDFDWSGVASGGNEGIVRPGWSVMVTPRHFLSATHYHAGNGTSVEFFHSNDPNGGSEVHTVSSGRRILNTDIWLGELDSDVSEDVAIYPILPTSRAVGSEIFVVGLSDSANTNTDKQISQRVGRNVIDREVRGLDALGRVADVIIYGYDSGSDGVGDDEAEVRGLDSGGPSFGVVNDQLALVGIHWFLYGDGDFDDLVAPTGSGDSFVSRYFDEINDQLATMTGGHSLLSAVPEPTSVTLLLMTGLAALGIRRREDLAA